LQPSLIRCAGSVGGIGLLENGVRDFLQPTDRLLSLQIRRVADAGSAFTLFLPQQDEMDKAPSLQLSGNFFKAGLREVWHRMLRFS
jgi:hypothetical protein